MTTIKELEDLEDKVGQILGVHKGNLLEEWMGEDGKLRQRFQDRTPLYARSYDQIIWTLDWLQKHCDSLDVCWTKMTGWAIYVWYEEKESKFVYLRGDSLPEVLARAVIGVNAELVK